MGFGTKLAGLIGVKKVDHAAEITRVHSGVTVHTTILALPAAAQSQGRRGGGLEKRIASGISSAVTDAVSSARHLGGPDNGLAYGIPRDVETVILALTDHGLSLWDFGMMGVQKTPPSHVFSAPRPVIATLEDTGKKHHGSRLARLTFTDESYADFGLVKPDDAFWETVRAW